MSDTPDLHALESALDESVVLAVMRLGRPHPGGGTVIERASILAEGADSHAIIAWVERRGRPEYAAARGAAARGLHSERGGPTGTPLRYVLPAGALS